MGLIDNGNQSKVFDYKQEGTSEGFNKIMYNLIPKGIIRGGNLVKSTDASVTVSPFLTFFEDPDKKVGVRIETSTNATSDISISKPYIIGRFTWLNLEDNYMDIISASFSEIEPSDLIFGRGIFNSGVLQDFDYSRKSWSKNFYDNNIDFEPSFLVVSNEPYDNKLKVGKGSAYINGKKVVFDSEKQTPSFDLNVTNGRKDLVVVNDDASITIIKGTDTVDPVAPLFPNKGLVVAVVTLPPNPTSINGGFVEYIYNNNYYSSQSVLDNATSSPTGNTLMKRDADGRSQVASPSADSDIATKKYVDDTASGDAEAVQTNLTAHINNKSNPHKVTLAQLGVVATATELNKLDGFTGSVNSLNCTNNLNSDAQGQLNGKAPISHASSSTTYGRGTTTSYGHVKVVDNPDLTSYPEGTAGVGVTPFGVVNLLRNLQQYWFEISDMSLW